MLISFYWCSLEYWAGGPHLTVMKVQQLTTGAPPIVKCANHQDALKLDTNQNLKYVIAENSCGENNF